MGFRPDFLFGQLWFRGNSIEVVVHYVVHKSYFAAVSRLMC